jgi:hypothetical protein
LAQPIDPKEGAAGADCDYKVRLHNIGPLDRQRAQPPLRACIGHAVAAPVVAHRQQIEALPSQRMERMGDRKDLRAMFVTICNARFTPRGAWNQVWATSKRIFCMESN